MQIPNAGNNSFLTQALGAAFNNGPQANNGNNFLAGLGGGSPQGGNSPFANLNGSNLNGGLPFGNDNFLQRMQLTNIEGTNIIDSLTGSFFNLSNGGTGLGQGQGGNPLLAGMNLGGLESRLFSPSALGGYGITPGELGAGSSGGVLGDSRASFANDLKSFGGATKLDELNAELEGEDRKALIARTSGTGDEADAVAEDDDKGDKTIVDKAENAVKTGKKVVKAGKKAADFVTDEDNQKTAGLALKEGGDFIKSFFS